MKKHRNIRIRQWVGRKIQATVMEPYDYKLQKRISINAD